MRLDPQQDAVVQAGLMPTLVVAGAGTGKTHTLIHRVAYWTQKELNPERTLLITFTQKAAREMQARALRLNPEQRLPWVGTFHAIAARLLRRYGSHLGLREDFRVVTRSESEHILFEVLSSTQHRVTIRDARRLLRLHSLSVNADLRFIDLLQSRRDFQDWSPEHLDDIMVEFLVSKLERNVLDYDDLLLYWSQLFRDAADVRTTIQSLFDAVFVDEYQDVNPLQVELVDALVDTHRRLTVVGDDRQSIYGFRGSDVGAILNFESRYPDAQVLSLETNYRSVGRIVRLAQESIRHNHHQRPTSLIADRPPGRIPVFHSVADDDEQAAFVQQRIQALIEFGVPCEDIAVLYRTHRQSQAIELALTAAQLPYTVRSGQRLLETPHVRALIHTLAIFVSHSDPSFVAPGFQLFDGIGPSTASVLAQRLTAYGWPHWMSPDLFLEQPSLVQRRSSIERVWQVLKSVKSRDCESVVAVVHAALDEVVKPWLTAHFPDDASRRYDECVQVVSRLAPDQDLMDFLGHLALEDADDSTRGITLSTIHRAKGLEWAAVFLIGIFDGGFPLGMSLDSPHDLEEERRLFYVALTRSREWLTLVHAWESASGAVQMPSRFVTELLTGASDVLSVESETVGPSL